MAREASAIVGSGINPLKKDVCFNQTTKERHLRGTSVIHLNPEDASAGCSGVVTAVTVGTTAVKLPTTPMVYRRGMSVANESNNRTLFVGFNPNVTILTGFPVPAGNSLPMDVNAEIEVYGVASADIDVRVLELS